MVASILQILITLGIAIYQIREGRRLNAENLKTNEENAGKNRVIYAVEQLDISRDNRAFDETLNKCLIVAILQFWPPLLMPEIQVKQDMF